MTNRRRFIKTLAAIPPALALNPVNAAADPSRLALIIGNSDYSSAPLVNPTNDAKAVSSLFTEAGFVVDSGLNSNRIEMLAAIERFGAAVKRSETRLVVFYYAGHGAQLEWRNYLLPVDAVVERQEHMKERCIDLSMLLGQFSAARDKTFIVILDACRDNPFGRSYRPDQKGLSQFDAPVGSLLAYATAPGNVASDGDGLNGLYTENLVRELSNRSTRLEDALKRVRLNVRLASRGGQIPWETTSLEGDTYIFKDGQKALTERELEQQVEADLVTWGRIKSSRNPDDWVSYLRNFPNGSFAEIAQARLTRMLAQMDRAKPLNMNAGNVSTPSISFATGPIQTAIPSASQRDSDRAEVIAAATRQREELRIKEEQLRIESERVREQQLRDIERRRIVEAEQLAALRNQQEEQRKREEQVRIDLALIEQRREALAARQERDRLIEQKRLDEEGRERERVRIAEVQRLAAESRQREELQLLEQRTRDEERQRAKLIERQKLERLRNVSMTLLHHAS